MESLVPLFKHYKLSSAIQNLWVGRGSMQPNKDTWRKLRQKVHKAEAGVVYAGSFLGLVITMACTMRTPACLLPRGGGGGDKDVLVWMKRPPRLTYLNIWSPVPGLGHVALLEDLGTGVGLWCCKSSCQPHAHATCNLWIRYGSWAPDHQHSMYMSSLFWEMKVTR